MEATITGAARPSETVMLVVLRILGLSVTALISGALIPAHLTAEEMPERTVRGNIVASSQDPGAQIELPRSAAYVGSDRWLLEAYSDNIELYAFVDAAADKHVKRLYWVQFEAYLPSRPELKHNYDSVRHITLGGMDFYVDTWRERTDRKDERDSDGAHLKAVLRSKGYTLPKSMISVRFVHLMDGARKELMLIYGEDAATAGFTPEEAGTGDKAHGRWLALQPRLIRQAELSFTFN
jgi:hypothetical protein